MPNRTTDHDPRRGDDRDDRSDPERDRDEYRRRPYDAGPEGYGPRGARQTTGGWYGGGYPYGDRGFGRDWRDPRDGRDGRDRDRERDDDRWREDPYTRAGVGGGQRWNDTARDRLAAMGTVGLAGRGFTPTAELGRQSFRGKGPKGYTRSDARIAEDLNDRLTDDDLVDASEVAVAVASGVVTLTGKVPERGMKYRAEELAEQVSGVRDIDNQIRVARDGRAS